ncbi:hypothetical protein JTB14_031851 [Gonioctena quinquepunctata]|nr:hypothetical protein JTB14_031851 [Gonioctena quinquepunctata]
MQLLNICRYDPSKSRCETFFNNFTVGCAGKAITIYDIAKLTSQPYLSSLTPHNILKAFEKTGIWPVNSLIFNDVEFAGVLSHGPDGISGTSLSGTCEPSTRRRVDNDDTYQPFTSSTWVPSTSRESDNRREQSSAADSSMNGEPITSANGSGYDLENTVLKEVNTHSSAYGSTRINTPDKIRPFPVLQPKNNSSTTEMNRPKEKENLKQAKIREQELKTVETVKLVNQNNTLGVPTRKTFKKKEKTNLFELFEL